MHCDLPLPYSEGTARWTIPILPTLNARGAKSSLEFELVRSLAPNWTGVAQWVVGNAARVSVRRSFEKAMTQVTMEVMQEHIAVIGQVNKEVSKHTLVQGTVIVSYVLPISNVLIISYNKKTISSYTGYTT